MVGLNEEMYIGEAQCGHPSLCYQNTAGTGGVGGNGVSFRPWCGQCYFQGLAVPVLPAWVQILTPSNLPFPNWW